MPRPAPALGCLLVSAILLVAVSPPASAAEETPRDRALAEFDAGRVEFEAGRFDAAAAHFKSAYKLDQDPVFLFNIGLAFEKVPRWLLAIEHYEAFLEQASDSPAAADVRRRLEAARTAREAAQARLIVESQPTGATATLISDADQPSCKTPCTLRSDPGPATVELSLDGVRKRVTGSVTVNGEWRINERLPEVADPGTAGASDEAGADLTPAWIAFGVAGAGLVTFAVAGGLALADHDEGKELASRPGALSSADHARLAELRRGLPAKTIAADIGIAVAAAGAIAGTVLIFTAGSSDDEPAAEVTAGAALHGDGGAGVVTWSF